MGLCISTAHSFLRFSHPLQYAGNEGGYEAQGHEGSRRGGPSDEGDEGNESHEGYEEGHEAQGHEGGRRGVTGDESYEGNESHEGYEEGHEGYEGNESHEGHEEGYEGHESNEGHEGYEEVNGWKCASLLLLSIGQVLCLEQWRGPSPRSLVHTLRALHLDHSSKK